MRINTVRLLMGVLLLEVALIVVSCNKDECKDQFCFNGGKCRNGLCDCPNNYYGPHCEFKKGYDCRNSTCVMSEGEGEYSTLEACQQDCGVGYVCLDGVTTYTTSNAVYKTKEECDNTCGGAGYRCVGGVCTYTNQKAQYKTASLCEGGCGKVIPGIVVNNRALTSMTVTINGVTKIIPGSSGVATFTGQAGQSAIGTASTAVYLYGQQVGLMVTTFVNTSFPSAGIKHEYLDVSSTYFYLSMKVAGSKSFYEVVVNSGSTLETRVQGSFTPYALGGNTFSLGYHYAQSNTVIRAYYTSTSYVYWTNYVQFTISGNSNQSVYVQATS
jgi:hypothetical protein